MDILHFLFLSEVWFKTSITFFVLGIIYGIYFITKFENQFEHYNRVSKILGVLFIGLVGPIIIMVFLLFIRFLDFVASLVW